MQDSTDIQEKRLGSAETFSALFDALRDYQGKALDSGYKTLGFMVVALGWLMTSQETRNFLQSHAAVRWAAIVFLILGCCAYGFMSYRMYALSQSVARRLATLNYASPDVYDHYIIKLAVPVMYSTLHLLISGVLIVAVAATAK